jgi:sugar lactone lactonase YvrE
MRQADYLARRAERLGEMAMKVEARRNSVCGQCATAGGEDVSGTAIGTELSAWIVDLCSGEVADFGCAAAHATAVQPDPLERAVGRRWLAAAASALVMGAYAAQVVVPAAENSLAPIVGIAPSYGPKTVSAVPNAPAIERRIWFPQLDAGYDPQGLAVDDGAIYVSAYRSDSLGVRRGPCRVIRIDLETGGSTGYVDVPSPCGHAGGLAVGGDGILYVADTHTLFATPLVRAFDGGARFRQFSLGPGVIGGLAASTPDGIWLGTYEDGPGRLFHFTAASLARLSDGETLEASQAATVLTIPDHAQGAAIGAGGLWIARSDWNWGTLDRLDPVTGAPQRRYEIAPGTEGIAFGNPGRLWAVSEAGSRHIYDHPFLGLFQPFFPLVFALDLSRLE